MGRVAGLQSHPILPCAPMSHIRVVALGLMRNGERVLVARGRDPVTGEVFHRPLGGGVEFGERAADALRREMREELGAEITEPRLIGVLENRFEYDGRPGHEIVFVFDAEFADRGWYEREPVMMEEGWEAVQWTPVAEVIRLVPEGLLDLLHTKTRRARS